MTTLREAAQQALEALENCTSEHGHRCNRCDSEVDEGGRVVTALRVALEQPEAQPVAWRYLYPDGFWRFSSGRRINGCDPVQSQALFTSPPVQAEKPQGGISDARAREIADAFAGHAGPEISGKGSEQAAQQPDPYKGWHPKVACPLCGSKGTVAYKCSYCETEFVMGGSLEKRAGQQSEPSDEEIMQIFWREMGGSRGDDALHFARAVLALRHARSLRQPLTEDEIIRVGKEARATEGPHILPITFARAIERAHGIAAPQQGNEK